MGSQDDDLGDKAKDIPPDWLANGVFHRHYYELDPNTNFFIKHGTVAMTDIKDGTQHTLLISENLQGGRMVQDPAGEPAQEA